ncbi:unnamed protein product, partial [Rangifer tarandus platyrhynchus]
PPNPPRETPLPSPPVCPACPESVPHLPLKTSPTRSSPQPPQMALRVVPCSSSLHSSSVLGFPRQLTISLGCSWVGAVCVCMSACSYMCMGVCVCAL